MRLILVLFVLFIMVVQSKAESSDIFTELRNTVGYIKLANGVNYLIVESKDGAKLIRTKKDPEKILKGSIGISKEDLKNLGE